ncbi:MAG: hypothetical protein A2Z25_01715 [Planctomycetes bacterium RBG_16_55_9]|nr:MAG: hypothetical protein A2Z25_01715 [Planctomycetes bacterium RBG_16_55_9]
MGQAPRSEVETSGCGLGVSFLGGRISPLRPANSVPPVEMTSGENELQSSTPDVHRDRPHPFCRRRFEKIVDL